MPLVGTLTLLSETITAAVTGDTPDGTGIPSGGVDDALTIQAVFTYGSGGTTAKAWVQTSVDDGTTWVDIANFAFTTSSARRLYTLTRAAVTSIATPSDGTLADNTAVNGFLGTLYRVKLTTTGTYAGDTTLVITADGR
jgi:hypothetical protein